MKVKDIMTKEVVCADSKMRIVEVAKILFDDRFHGMPVVDDGKLVGIVTESDFFSQKDNFLFLPEYIDFLKDIKTVGKMSLEEKKEIKQIIDSKVADIMTRDCLTVNPETEVSDLIDIIKRTGFNSLPVVDENKTVVGIVTLVDVIGLLKDDINVARKSEDRKLDELIDDTNNIREKKYSLMSRREISTWKGSLVIFFLGGFLVFLLWIISIKNF